MEKGDKATRREQKLTLKGASRMENDAMLELGDNVFCCFRWLLEDEEKVGLVF